MNDSYLTKMAHALVLPVALMAGAVQAAVAPTGVGVYSGSFTEDDNVEIISLSLDKDATYRLISFGYGGGKLSTGAIVAPGGFDTWLTLFDASGSYIADNDDFDGANADPVSGSAYDAGLILDLAAGNYYLAVTQWDNDYIGDLSEGFSREGQGNFTQFDCPAGAERFCDTNGNIRTSDWVVDVTVVPVPAALPLFVTAIAGLGWVGRRRLRDHA